MEGANFYLCSNGLFNEILKNKNKNEKKNGLCM